MAEAVQVVCPHCDAINRVPAARLADGPRCGGCREPLFMGRSAMLDEPRTRRHLGHNALPVLVDFWASWCGPCRAMAPEFDAAAKSLEPRMRLAKLNVDDAPALSRELHISGVPALVLFDRGAEVARQVGGMRAGQIVEWADEALRASARR